MLTLMKQPITEQLTCVLITEIFYNRPPLGSHSPFPGYEGVLTGLSITDSGLVCLIKESNALHSMKGNTTFNYIRVR